MESVIGAIVGILAILGAGALSKPFFYKVQKETVTRVQYGLKPLQGFTQKLTGKKLKL